MGDDETGHYSSLILILLEYLSLRALQQRPEDTFLYIVAIRQPDYTLVCAAYMQRTGGFGNHDFWESEFNLSALRRSSC